MAVSSAQLGVNWRNGTVAWSLSLVRLVKFWKATSVRRLCAHRTHPFDGVSIVGCVEWRTRARGIGGSRASRSVLVTFICVCWPMLG